MTNKNIGNDSARSNLATGGDQKTQIVDGSGVVAGVTASNNLNASIEEIAAALLTAASNQKMSIEEINTTLATVDGNLKIANAEDSLEIAKGNVTGTSFIHKFGNAGDFDADDNDVTVWDCADNATAIVTLMNAVYSATDDIDSISSTNAGDGQDIEIQGLDANYDLVIQTRTLQGLTRVALSTDLIRVFRMKNVGATNNAGHVVCYVNGADTTPADGVPDNNNLIRAVMQPGNNQTLMAIYTVPNGCTAYLGGWYASISGARKTSNYTIDLLARPFGQVFQIKHKAALSDTGSSHIDHNYKEPEVFAAKTDIEIRVTAEASGVSEASISAGFDIVLVND